MGKPKQTAQPDIEPTFRDLLLEQLAVLAAALPENRTLQRQRLAMRVVADEQNISMESIQ